MEQNGRDNSGRFIGGHPGFKKPKTEFQRLSRTKLGEFLQDKINDLGTIYDELSPKEKARLLLAVVEYFLPKPRELTVEIDNVVPQVDLTKLSQSALQELLTLTNND